MHRLRFASDGETLWLSRETTRRACLQVISRRGSRPCCYRAAPASLSEAAASLGLSLLKTVELRTPGGPAGAPVDLALARRAPIASGTTIRMPPDKAAVFVSTLSGAQGPASSRQSPPTPRPTDDKIRGALLRGDLNGQARPLSEAGEAEIVAGLDLSPGLSFWSRLACPFRWRAAPGGDRSSGRWRHQPAAAEPAPDLAADRQRPVSASQIPVLLQP